MTTTTLCPVCGDPSDDGLLCRRETIALVAALRDLPELMVDLRVTATRQAKTSKPGAVRGTGGTPLAFGYDASWTYDAVVGTLTAWIRAIAEEFGEDLNRSAIVAAGHAATVVRWWAPGTTVTEWVEWLTARLPRVRGHKDVAALVDELHDAVRSARKAVDRPADREYVTLCSVCGHGVYGPAGAPDETWVTCKECRRVALRDEHTGEVTGYVPEYQVGAERLNRLTALQTSLIPAQDLKTAMVLSRNPVNPRTITSWIHRGRLTPRGCRADDHAPLFLVGDALTLAAQIPQRRTSA